MAHLSIVPLFLCPLCLCIAIPAAAQQPQSQQPQPRQLPPATPEPITLAAGVPLHIRVTHTARLRTGTPVHGVLTEPIYVRDRLVLPAGSAVQGTVTAYTPIPRIDRQQAILNGDITPLHNPVVDFSSIHIPTGDVALSSHALIRSSKLVRFTNAKRPSLIHQAIAGIKTRIHDTYEVFAGPNKSDRAERFLFGQLPYHPQRIWVGTEFIADLNAPTAVSLPAVPPVLTADTSLNGITVTARLASTLDSSSAHKGDPVTALITTPVFDSDRRLLLPEGTQIDGLVASAKPARSFGRNGQLRFAIRGVKKEDQASTRVFGTLTGAEGDPGQNLSVDSEGNVKANPDKDRFVAPLLLAVTAAVGHDRDRDGNGLGRTTVASNGFGLIARVLALTVNDRNVATGFGAYAFAKSIYFRFLIRGHEVTFDKDTLVEVTLAERDPATQAAPAKLK